MGADEVDRVFLKQAEPFIQVINSFFYFTIYLSEFAVLQNSRFFWVFIVDLQKFSVYNFPMFGAVAKNRTGRGFRGRGMSHTKLLIVRLTYT